MGQPFQEAVARGASDADLAALAVDDVLVTRLGTSAATVAALRRAGASTSEAILSVALGLTPRDVGGVVRRVLAR